MATELFKNIPSKVGDLVRDVRIGKIGLPDLQRPFVWKDNKIRELYDSMLKGYPIGYIMLWESPADYDEKKSGIGINGKIYTEPKELVIDGQQRLTALVASMYVVKGQLSWGHCLKIFDTEENELGTVKQEVLTWLPKFELYEGENYIGCLEKELGWFKPKYNIDFNGWHVEGDFPGWDYTITKPVGETVATVSKELLQWTDTYVLDIVDPADALHVLMFVLAIDAEKCSAK